MLTRDSTWYGSPHPPDWTFLLIAHSQISVMTDMVALPLYMSESLKKAKGSYSHAVVQGVKKAAGYMVSGAAAEGNS